MGRSADLYSLQITDLDLDAATQRLDTVNQELLDTGELMSARQRLENAREELRAWGTQQRDQELTLSSLEHKKRASEQRLYGGKIRNPKELSDLHEEVASLNRRKAVIEDELLETMLMVEEGEEEQDQAVESLTAIESDWKATQARLHSEKESLEEKLSDLADLRQQQIAIPPAADLAKYEHLRQRKRGRPVALLNGAECQRCMTGVSAARVKEARGEGLAICGTCGRILHIC
ncbi:MAG: hypothetical protein KAS81_07585 [Anaerolineales bacterium]|nr:hypothetical protein [Anaerolineales bacterium]